MRTDGIDWRHVVMLMLCWGVVSLVADAHAEPGEAESDASASATAETGEGDAEQAAAEQEMDPHERARLDRMWKANWRRYASQFVLLDGKFYHFPNFSPTMFNSRGKNSNELQTSFDLRYHERVGRVTVTKSKPVPLPKEDVQVACYLLPAFKPGEYGYVQSMKVVDRDEDRAVVQQIRLIPQPEVGVRTSTYYSSYYGSVRRYNWVSNNVRWDDTVIDQQKMGVRDEVKKAIRPLGIRSTSPVVEELLDFMFTYRDQINEVQKSVSEKQEMVLRGFDDVPRRGETYESKRDRRGIHVAIIAEDKQRRPIAVPVELVKSGITEEQFIEMLKRGGVTRDTFCQKIFDLAGSRMLPSERDAEILQLLESAMARQWAD